MRGDDSIIERSELKAMSHKGVEVVSEDRSLQAATRSSQTSNATLPVVGRQPKGCREAVSSRKSQ